MTDFLAGIADEKDFSAIQDFLSLVAHATIPETALINALDSEPPEGGSVVQAWRHDIACFLLNNKLARLFPNDATLIQPQLAELLRHSYSYQALDDLLDTLLQANGQQASPSPDAVSRAKQFNQALDILCDYQLGETTRARALKVFQELPPADWESEIHFLAISSTFQSAHQRSVEELVDWIAEKSPQAFFANDREALQTSYQAVMAAYNLNSEVESIDKPICQWDKPTITRWAKCVKAQAKQPDTTPVTQQERVAVVKRAVELHEGFSPRATQLLAVLILRNPASNTGRLVQLNTGEGKSLIIAMLAALHALEGKPVDVLTTSTELSKREVAKYAAFFEMLDLSVGENSDYASKREVYKKAIVYGTPLEFQGDVLRDEFSGYDWRGKRKFRVLLVDEVDALLFDNRSSSIYLTSQTPAMNHLAIVLAAIWYQVNNLARHLIEIEGQTFFVAEDFKVEGEQITVFSDKELSDCLVPVNDKEDFITKNTQAHLEKLLRELDPTEQAAWQDYRQLKARIETLSQAIEQQENETKRKEKEAECKQLSEQLSQSPFSQAYPILEIPNHLRAFAKQQTPYWIKNALLAQFLYQKEVHCVLTSKYYFTMDIKRIKNSAIERYEGSTN